MKEIKFKKGYCQKCLIQERKNIFIKNDADSLCHKCYKISKFCIVCYNTFNTDGYLCNYCFNKWKTGKLEKCPYCQEDKCGTRRGDPIKYCTNNSQYTNCNEFNSLINYVYSQSPKYTNKN